MIGQKPTVYYTGKPIEKGIRTTIHKQNRLKVNCSTVKLFLKLGKINIHDMNIKKMQ